MSRHPFQVATVASWLIGAAVVLIGAGIIMVRTAAQETTPEATPDVTSATCDPAAVLARKDALDAALATFEADLAADSNAALENLYEVGAAYQQLALDCGYIPGDIGERVINSTDLNYVMTIIADLPGDSVNGQVLYASYGCVGCHSVETIAPSTEGTWTRVDEIRLSEPQFAGYTHEQYLVESILLPWHYVVPSYGETMPNNFDQRLTFQELSDIVAYLMSQDQYLE